MKKTKIMIIIVAGFILLSQFYLSSVNRAYAASDIVIDTSLSSDDWSDDESEIDILPFFNNQSTYTDSVPWELYNMDFAGNENSLEHWQGFGPQPNELPYHKPTSAWFYVDLRNLADQIDAGDIYYKAMVDMGNNAYLGFIVIVWVDEGKDTQKLIVSFYDENKNLITNDNIAKKPDNKTWLNNVSLGKLNTTNGTIEEKKIPEGTRYLKYEVTGIDDSIDDAEDNGCFTLFANPRLYIYDKQGPIIKEITSNKNGDNAETILIDNEPTVILKKGDHIDFTVEFNEPVVIDCNLLLKYTLDDGDPNTNDTKDGYATFYHAEEDILDGGRKYVFHGIIPDNIDDNMYLKTDCIEFPDWGQQENIRDYRGNIILDLHGTLSGKTIMVDTNNPEIESIISTNGDAVYKEGEEIGFTVKFTEPVKAIDTNKLLLNIDGAFAAYVSGDGTDTFNYRYTIAGGDNISSLKVLGIDGVIKDRTGKALSSLVPTQTYNIGIDTEGPSISFKDEDGEPYVETQTYKKEHKVYINVTDNVSGPDDIYYLWDNNASTENYDDISEPATNGTASVPNPVGISGDNFYLHVKAYDIAENVSIETLGPFYLDDEKPEVTINPESGIGELSYEVIITANDDESGIKEINYKWIKKDDNKVVQQGIINSGDSITSPEMDGSYVIIIDAIDNAENIENKISGDFIVDKKAPTVSFSAIGSDIPLKLVSVDIDIVEEKSTIKSGYYQWSKSVIKPEEDDDNWIEFYSLDDSNLLNSYSDTINSNEDMNGTYYLHIKCEDSTGNIGVYTTSTGFKLDNEKPNLEFTPNGTSNAVKEFMTELSVNNESDGYTVKYEISNNTNNSFEDDELNDYLINENEKITFNIDKDTGENITDTYYIHVKVEDEAGNVSTLSSEPIYIDNTAPTGNIKTTNKFTNNSSYQIEFLSNDIHPNGCDEDIYMRISLDGEISWIDFEGNQWIPFSQTKQISLTEERVYDLAVQYKDIAENISEVYTSQMIYDISSPEISNIQYNDEWTNEDQDVILTFNDNFTESNDISIEIISDETTADVIVNNNIIIFKNNGICSFKYKDKAGNENTDTITISNFDKTPPIINLSIDGNDEVSQTASTKVLVEDNVTTNSSINVYYCWSKNSDTEPSDWQRVNDDRNIEINDVNGDYYLWIKALDQLGNKSIFTSKSFILDNEKPEVLDVIYNPDVITANNVTARIEFNEDVRILEPTLQNELLKIYEYTFVENGTKNVVFVDKAGNQDNYQLEVFWIDKSIPGANEVYSPDGYTNDSVIVTITPDTSKGSLYNFRPYIDGERIMIESGANDSLVEECVNNWNEDTEEYLLSSDEHVTTTGESIYTSNVKLIDVTVNDNRAVTKAKFELDTNAHITYNIIRLDTDVTGDGEIVVDKIDKEKPTATLTYTSKNMSWSDEEDEEWTNEDVKVIINTSDNSGQPVEILNNDGSNLYIFDDNGSFDFRLRDAAGNENTITASVQKIDREDPTAKVNYISGDKKWNDEDDEKWTNEDVEVILEVSDNSGEPVEILNNDGRNKYLFIDNGKFIFVLKDEAGNEKEITTNVTKIDRIVPNPIIDISTQEWTNDDVRVSITFDNEEEDVIILNNDSDNEYDFTENGTFTFEFEDAAGNEDQITVVVNNIDKVIPKVKELWYSTTKPTNGKVKAKVYIDENVKFLPDGEGDSFVFEDNGSHEFRFIDRANNENSVMAIVENIDRISPNAWIEYSTSERTNDDVIATIKANEDIYVLNNCNKNQYVFTENGTFNFYYQDLAGNAGEIEAMVDYIDKTLPVISLEYSESEPTQNNVEVTISSDKIITPVNYTSNIICFEQNGTKWLKAIDEFGVEFYFEVEVSNIDREKPKIEFLEGENLIIEKDSSFDPLSDVNITDNIDTKISEKILVTHNIDANIEGEYEIIYSAKDSAGNDMSFTRKAVVLDASRFTTLVNSNIVVGDEIVTESRGISLEILGIEGNLNVKYLKGKKNKGDFKGCEDFCEDGYININESGYYTLYVQDQERNTKLIHVFVIYSEENEGGR